jgi:hypothetical protein
MWGIAPKWQNPFRSEHFPRSSRGKPTHFWGIQDEEAEDEEGRGFPLFVGWESG